MSTTANILKKLNGTLIINGELLPTSSATLKIKNPATSDVVGAARAATSDDVEKSDLDFCMS